MLLVVIWRLVARATLRSAHLSTRSLLHILRVVWATFPRWTVLRVSSSLVTLNLNSHWNIIRIISLLIFTLLSELSLVSFQRRQILPVLVLRLLLTILVKDLLRILVLLASFTSTTILTLNVAMDNRTSRWLGRSINLTSAFTSLLNMIIHVIFRYSSLLPFGCSHDLLPLSLQIIIGLLPVIAQINGGHNILHIIAYRQINGWFTNRNILILLLLLLWALAWHAMLGGSLARGCLRRVRAHISVVMVMVVHLLVVWLVRVVSIASLIHLLMLSLTLHTILALSFGTSFMLANFFGAGPRLSIGSHLSVASLRCVLVVLIHADKLIDQVVKCCVSLLVCISSITPLSSIWIVIVLLILLLIGNNSILIGHVLLDKHFEIPV
jgi:hypothetical protein